MQRQNQIYDTALALFPWCLLSLSALKGVFQTAGFSQKQLLSAHQTTGFHPKYLFYQWIAHNSGCRSNVRIEFRLQLSTVVMSRMVGFGNLLKTAALPLHIAQSAENICKDGIASCGGNAGQVSFLYSRTVGHTTGRINGKAVIVNINVYLTAQYQIITMDQRIDKRLENASFAVIRHFNAGICGLRENGWKSARAARRDRRR